MQHFSRFAVYRNSRGSRSIIPYLLDVQADGAVAGSRVVVPLIPLKKYGPVMSKLNPVFEFDGTSYVMATGDIAAISASELKQPADDFSRHRTLIVAALDFLFQGY